MTESWLRTHRATWIRRAAAVGTLTALTSAWLVFGRADVQVDGPVVRQETAWLRGASGGSDAKVGGLLTIEDGCVLLGGLPVVWPEGFGWDDDHGRLTVGGRALDADTGSVELYGGGGVTDDFAATAAGWDDDDVTPETAPCHYEAERVVVFNADERLEEIHRFE